MIYIDLRGNLGNQLFEYAFARSIQEITKQDICVNSFYLSKYTDIRCRLTDYVLNPKIIFDSEHPLPYSAIVYKGPKRYLRKLFPVAFEKFMSKKGKFIWLGSTYIDFPILPVKENYYLVGWWQSAKYFASVDSIIRKEFTPRYLEFESNKELYEKIRSTQSICVTIRRGDYVSNKKFRKIFYLCEPEFFIDGIRLIRQKIPNAAVFFFSDDIEWVKKNIKINGEVYYESGKDPVYEKLRLMSACKHFVISNSSFSWWAQHLSSNSNKIVVAPSKWYPDGRRCDIYEDGWELLKV